MESPGDYLEPTMDGDDIAYPCKGCGEVSIKVSVRRSGLNVDSLDP
jgi:hypothetical protein